jgi:urease subunit gamma
MNLSPSETEKLLLAVAGMVARVRLDRGVLLNYPESVALLTTWVIERAREGARVADLDDRCASAMTSTRQAVQRKDAITESMISLRSAGV